MGELGRVVADLADDPHSCRPGRYRPFWLGPAATRSSRELRSSRAFHRFGGRGVVAAGAGMVAAPAVAMPQLLPPDDFRGDVLADAAGKCFDGGADRQDHQTASATAQAHPG